MGINKDKKNIKKLVLCILLVIFLVLQIAFLSYLVKGLTSKKTSQPILMKYTSKGKFDYQVVLKSSDIISIEDLKKGNAYIMDFVDHISITSYYDFLSTKQTEVLGSNKLIARLSVYYRASSNVENNPELLKKDVVLKEDAIDIEDTKYNNIQTYDLYLKEYMDILDTFERDIRISVEGYLEIISQTSFNGNIGGAKYNDKYENIIKIPLSDTVFKISPSLDEAQTKNVYTNDLVKTNTAVKSYLIIANAVIFLILMLLLKRLFMYTDKNEYLRAVKKITRTYDDIVVDTFTMVDIGKYNIIEINEFKELLNLSRELLLPIMNYELIKNAETWFYVIKDNNLYRYIISKNMIEQNNKKGA